MPGGGSNNLICRAQKRVLVKKYLSPYGVLSMVTYDTCAISSLLIILFSTPWLVILLSHPPWWLSHPSLGAASSGGSGHSSSSQAPPRARIWMPNRHDAFNGVFFVILEQAWPLPL